MKPFEYVAPKTLEEAVETLAERGEAAWALAGGTDLLPQMKADRVAPKSIVNLKRIPGLDRMEWDERAGLRIGALTKVAELMSAAVVRERYPALAQAALSMASPQIRNLATVGGNLCNASPAADLAPPLLALGACVRLAGPNGERRLTLDQFFVGPGETALTRGELLVEIELPPPDGIRSLYLKHAHRQAMDLAIVGVAVALRIQDGVCDDIRLALGAVAPTPLRAGSAEMELRGRSPTPEAIERVAKAAAEESSPIDDVRGSAWYRRRMVEVMTRRGLRELAGL